MAKIIEGGRDPTTGKDNVPCPYGLTYEYINGYHWPYYVGNVCDCCKYVARDKRGRYIHEGDRVSSRYEELTAAAQQ